MSRSGQDYIILAIGHLNYKSTFKPKCFLAMERSGLTLPNALCSGQILHFFLGNSVERCHLIESSRSH